ncbi:MAG: flippase-like domain-containing protein [Alphaproteobacteria bacterium]|nr:flippase-like domain-containing protein [Alphaproteobacteria bacterium]MCB9692094.1 flippase-like domain-containing protein [Alphaproteobacteria bacterium]
MTPWLLVGTAALSFAGVAWLAWKGSLGLVGLVLVLASFGLYFAGHRGLPADRKRAVGSAAKAVFTVVGIMALLRHPIDADGVKLPLYEALWTYLQAVDPQTFVFWGLAAMGIKFVGVLGSAFAWWMLLRGQGIHFPFWQKIVTAFLIGRFIGTFLPSTLGLDGYTLYEAVRYSNAAPRAVTAKVLEKFIGVTGLFLGMVLTLPFGYQVIVDVTSHTGNPDAAPMLAGAILLVAGGISASVVVGLVWPWFLVRGMDLVAAVLHRLPLGDRVGGVVKAQVTRFTAAVGAYEGKVGLLMLALLGKFVTHFTTAVVYFFTALAIGVVGAKFWPIVFGSTIQILATLLSPTIAGEGAREAFQALLLAKQLNGVAPAVLSGALGFIAAEAATLWGGLFLFTRTPAWRPTFAIVDGQQVDYAWITDDGGFDVDRISALRADQPTT